MNVKRIETTPQQDVTLDGAVGVKMRMLIGPDDGANVFHMRCFTVAPGGNTPLHAHDYEHEVLVLAGVGVVHSAQGALPLRAGDVVWAPPNETHQFRNTGDAPLEFICLIPAPRCCTE